LVDYYHEVTALLAEIERAYYANHVFVSGSAHKFAPSFDEDRMRAFCMLLGEQLIRQQFTVVSGLGLTIGDSLLKGALGQLFSQHERNFEKRLCLRPFPRSLPAGLNEDEYNFRYRAAMIARSNVAIFIAGTSRSSELSKGVLHEYSIARACGLVPIPIGVTGFAARRLWEIVAHDISGVYGGAVPLSLFQRLNDETASNEEVVEAMFEVMRRATGRRGPPAVLAD
jgi:hypothetical protein